MKESGRSRSEGFYCLYDLRVEDFVVRSLGI